MGTNCGGPAGLGLPGLEGSAAKDSRLVHPQAADAVSGGGSRTHSSLVAPSRRAPRAISLHDQQISGIAGPIGLGCGLGSARSALRRCGVTRLSVGTRKGIEPDQRRFTAGRSDDDYARLGNHLVTVVAKK